MLMDGVDSYLAYRRASNFEMRAQEYVLRSFARFATGRGEKHVKTKTVIDWASRIDSKYYRIRSFRTVLLLARFLQTEDQRHELPPPHIFGPRGPRPIPFIFTPAEIDQILLAASRLGPPGSSRSKTYATLFGLLAATGLRISEALRLEFCDITPDGLFIRMSKFKKSRIIPLHETTIEGLQNYLRWRIKIPTADPHVFLSTKRVALSRSCASRAFRLIRSKIDFDPSPCGRLPRIHDLRHTFACRALETCSGNRMKVDRQIRALSIYMGHVSIYSTYWYLESTVPLMASIADACETYMGGIS